MLHGRCHLLIVCFSFRRRTLHSKGRSASADLASVSSSRPATTLSCASPPPSISASQKSHTSHPQRTHRQTVLGRTCVDDDAATRDPPLRHHHRQPRHHGRCHHCYLVGCMVRGTRPFRHCSVAQASSAQVTPQLPQLHQHSGAPNRCRLRYG